VTSLTRAAAREAARVVSLPDRQVGTWHSFAYHGLGEPQLTEQHIKDWNANYKRWQQSGGDRNGEVYLSSEDCADGDKLMLEYSRRRAAGEDVHSRGRIYDFDRFVAAWEDWKTQCGYIDFNDVIDRACDLDAAPGDPDVIYCDEAQDLSLQEAKLAAKWGKRAQLLCLAGDDHQAIFGWRGSDPIAVREVWDGLSAQTRKHANLEQSYRVPLAVHHVAMRQMKQCRTLQPVAYRPREEAGLAVSGPSFYPSGLRLAQTAMRYAGDDETIMFIASCGYMLQSVMQGLEQLGEPWCNPWRKASRLWNPMEASKGVSFYERVLAFMAPSRDIWGENARFWSVEQLKLWIQPLPVSGIFESRAKTQIGGLDSKTTSEQIAEGMRNWFTASALERITHCDLGWYLNQIAPGKLTMAGKILKKMAERRQVEQIAKPPRMIVGTVHSLKGAEADVVCVCPDISAAAGRAASADNRVREEINRVFYVAVTRAKRALILCAPSSNRFMPF